MVIFVIERLSSPIVKIFLCVTDHGIVADIIYTYLITHYLLTDSIPFFSVLSIMLQALLEYLLLIACSANQGLSFLIFDIIISFLIWLEVLTVPYFQFRVG